MMRTSSADASEHRSRTDPQPLDEIRGWARSIDRAIARLGQDATKPVNEITVLRTVKDAMDALAASGPLVAAMLNEASTRAEQRFHELDSALREAFGTLGWSCDGQWPTLYVHRAVKVEIDATSRSAIVGANRVEDVTVEKIIEALTPQIKTLVPAKFSAIDMLDEIAAAYDAARQGSSSAPILEVYKHYVIRLQKSKFWRSATEENFVSLSADQFRARLTACIEAGVTSSRDGRSIRLLPPIDPSDGLFMYQPFEKRFGFVGRLEFVA